MDQAAELDDPEEHGQQDKGHRENGLKRFLTALSAQSPAGHWLKSLATIWPIFAARP